MKTVRSAMISRPRTIASTCSVGAVRAEFENDHVHMVLLTDGGLLAGTLVRGDLPPRSGPGSESDPALPWSVLRGRTISADASADDVRRDLVDADLRRLAVTADGGVLLGLLCLKRHRRGFCDDAGVSERRSSRSLK